MTDEQLPPSIGTIPTVHRFSIPRDFVLVSLGPQLIGFAIEKELDNEFGKYWTRDRSGFKDYGALGFTDGLQSDAVEITDHGATLSGDGLLKLMILIARRNGRNESTNRDLMRFLVDDALNNAERHLINVTLPIAEGQATGDVVGSRAKYSVAAMRGKMGEKWLAHVETKRVDRRPKRRRAKHRCS